jgi:chorismate-pyruvate lyase
VEPISSSYPVDLNSLLALFYSEPAELGVFSETVAAEMSATARNLLAHEMHMTVTVENFHRSSVDVTVVRSRREHQFYSREILLRRRSDNAVVLYGIVRLNFDLLASQVIQEIESESKPLGKILIDHHVLRAVHLDRLYKIQPGPHLCELLGLAVPLELFGRTASILCDAKHAVELLEIVV